MEESAGGENQYGVSAQTVNRIRRDMAEELRTHFVFNAMNGICFLIRKDPERAYTLMHDLAKFMRGSVEALVSQGDIPLREELVYGRACLNLEQLQRKYLAVRWRVQEMDGYVPCGILGRSASELLKKHRAQPGQEILLSVEGDGKNRELRIFIDGTREVVKVPIRDGNDKEIYEDYIGG